MSTRHSEALAPSGAVAARSAGRFVLFSVIVSSALDCGPKQECSDGESRCGSSKQTEICFSGWRDGESAPYHEWRSNTACTGARACVMVEGMGAKCVENGQKDPACGQAARYCDGDSIITCAAGYGVDRTECGSTDSFGVSKLEGGLNATRCITSASAGATCVPAAAKVDPQCAGSSGPHCDGGALVECVEGYAVFRSGCRTCVIAPSATSCPGCAPFQGQCSGYLGSFCQADDDCAADLVCHVAPGGGARCSAPCTVSADASTTVASQCALALGAGELPLSSYSEIQPTGVALGGKTSFPRPYPTLSCIAGFCTWVD